MSERPEPDDPAPLPLQYFAPGAPASKASRGEMFRWLVLGVGWLPFACGVASSRIVVRSGLQEVIRVHVNAGAAFMAVGGLGFSPACVAFSRAPAGWGAPAPRAPPPGPNSPFPFFCRPPHPS